MPKQSSFSCRISPITSRGRNLNLEYTACRTRLKWHCILLRIPRKIIFLEKIWNIFFSYRKCKETHTLQVTRSFQSFFDNNQSLNQSDCDHLFKQIRKNKTIFSKSLVLSVETHFLGTNSVNHKQIFCNGCSNLRFLFLQKNFAGKNKSISLKQSTKQQCKMMWLCLLTVLALHVVNFALTFTVNLPFLSLSLYFYLKHSWHRDAPRQNTPPSIVWFTHGTFCQNEQPGCPFLGIFFNKKFWQVKKCIYIPLAYWKNKTKQKHTKDKN